MAGRKCVVIDNGSLSLKIGLSDADKPSSVIPTFAAYDCAPTSGARPVCTGEEANERRVDLRVSSAIQRGVITDWNAMENLWENALKSVTYDPADLHVVLTEPLSASRPFREKLFEMWFEKFQAKSVVSMCQPLLSFFSTGLKTGITIDIGDGLTQISALVHSTPIVSSFARINLAGSDLTDYMLRLLAFRGFPFRTSCGREIARHIKEQMCYVAFDPAQEKLIPLAEKQESYALPDGNVVILDEERHACCEPLFDPAILETEHISMAQAVVRAIQACPIDVRRELAANIFVSGGTSMLPGFVDRMQKDVMARLPASMAVRVQHANRAEYSAWFGASVFALLPEDSRRGWVHVDDFQAAGAGIIRQATSSPF